MRLFRSAPVIVAGLLLLVALGAPAAVAKAPPKAGHPLVGAWVVTAGPPGEPPALVTIAADGSVVYLSPYGPSLGSWKSTGDSTADVTLLSWSFSGQEGHYDGLSTIRSSVEVAPDGDSFTGTFTIQAAVDNGAPGKELGPGGVTGKRIAVEPMGTPAGPLPTPTPPPAPSAEPEGRPAPSASAGG